MRSRQPRVFVGADLSHDTVLASACLPQVLRAVHIDGEPCRDGDYSGNPAIWPLICRTDAMDIVLVKINPLVHADLLDTADDDGLVPLNGSSKMNTDRRFLEALQALGRAAAERWLQAHGADLGVRSTLDIAASFLAPREVAAR